MNDRGDLLATMQRNAPLWTRCDKCEGTGSTYSHEDSISHDCVECDGEGKIPVELPLADIYDFIDRHQHQYDDNPPSNICGECGADQRKGEEHKLKCWIPGALKVLATLVDPEG